MKSQFSMQKKIKISFLMVIACLAFSAIVMLLWNAILPQVLVGVKAISFLQAIGILILSKLLFGGFRGAGWGAQRRGRWMEMQNKMAAMTPQEREKFKSEWKSRCGHRWKSGSVNSNSATE